MVLLCFISFQFFPVDARTVFHKYDDEHFLFGWWLSNRFFKKGVLAWFVISISLADGQTSLVINTPHGWV